MINICLRLCDFKFSHQWSNANQIDIRLPGCKCRLLLINRSPCHRTTASECEWPSYFARKDSNFVIWRQKKRKKSSFCFFSSLFWPFAPLGPLCTDPRETGKLDLNKDGWKMGKYLLAILCTASFITLVLLIHMSIVSVRNWIPLLRVWKRGIPYLTQVWENFREGPALTTIYFTSYWSILE